MSIKITYSGKNVDENVLYDVLADIIIMLEENQKKEDDKNE